MKRPYILLDQRKTYCANSPSTINLLIPMKSQPKWQEHSSQICTNFKFLGKHRSAVIEKNSAGDSTLHSTNTTETVITVGQTVLAESRHMEKNRGPEYKAT